MEAIPQADGHSDRGSGGRGHAVGDLTVAVGGPGGGRVAGHVGPPPGPADVRGDDAARADRPPDPEATFDGDGVADVARPRPADLAEELEGEPRAIRPVDAQAATDRRVEQRERVLAGEADVQEAERPVQAEHDLRARLDGGEPPVGVLDAVPHDFPGLLAREPRGLVLADHLVHVVAAESGRGRGLLRLRRRELRELVDVAGDVPRTRAVGHLHPPAAVVPRGDGDEHRAEVGPFHAPARAGVVGIRLRASLADVVDGARRRTHRGAVARPGRVVGRRAVRARLVAARDRGRAGHQEVRALGLRGHTGGRAGRRDHRVGVVHRPVPGPAVGADLAHGDAIPGTEVLGTVVVLRVGHLGEGSRDRAEESEGDRDDTLLHDPLRRWPFSGGRTSGWWLGKTEMGVQG